MKDPIYYLEQFQNNYPFRFPGLQRGLSITNFLNTDNKITIEQLFTIICTSSVCYYSSYENAILKLMNVVNGNELVSATFDGSLSITFYHYSNGAVTYSISKPILDKLNNMTFFVEKLSGTPVQDIPKEYSDEVLKEIFTYDDTQIFDIKTIPYCKVKNMIQELIKAKSH